MRTISPFKVLLFENSMSSIIVPRLVSSNFFRDFPAQAYFCIFPEEFFNLLQRCIDFMRTFIENDGLFFLRQAASVWSVALFSAAKIRQKEIRCSVIRKPPAPERRQ